MLKTGSHAGDERVSAARQALAQGQLPRAAQLAGELLAANPEDVDALEILSLVQVERGEHDAAIRTLRAAIAAAPQRRWPYADLSRLLLRLGRAEEAEKVADEALAADPRNPDAHAILGAIHAERERWFESEKHYRAAIAGAGPHPQLLTGLGQAQLRHGQLGDARATLTAATEADPHLLEPLVCLAEVEERSGRFPEATTLLDRAEPLARREGTDLDLQRSTLLARMGRTEDALAILGERPDMSGAARLHRGRLLERLGRSSEAWSEWQCGKRMLAERHGRTYRADEIAAEADKLASFFGSARASALPRAERRAGVPQPLFIIGFPRSGTTLLEQILASHSRIRAAGELPFGAEMRDAAAQLAGGEAEFPARLAHSTGNGAADVATRLREFYLARAQAFGLLGANSAYFTDKMPLNEFWLPLLRLAFPQSPVILVRRHPLDVITSVMANDMTHGFNCGYRVEDAARHLALMDRLVRRYAEAGFGPTLELRYEDLVADQRGETDRLMKSIGLPVEEAQLSFYERTEVSPTPSYAQVREPLNDRSIGRWRKFEPVLADVVPVIAQAMARGGYAV